MIAASTLAWVGVGILCFLILGAGLFLGLIAWEISVEDDPEEDDRLCF